MIYDQTGEENEILLKQRWRCLSCLDWNIDPNHSRPVWSHILTISISNRQNHYKTPIFEMEDFLLLLFALPFSLTGFQKESSWRVRSPTAPYCLYPVLISWFGRTAFIGTLHSHWKGQLSFGDLDWVVMFDKMCLQVWPTLLLCSVDLNTCSFIIRQCCIWKRPEMPSFSGASLLPPPKKPPPPLGRTELWVVNPLPAASLSIGWADPYKDEMQMERSAGKSLALSAGMSIHVEGKGERHSRIAGAQRESTARS